MRWSLTALSRTRCIRNMDKLLTTFWVMPLVATPFGIAVFASVFLQAFPLPYYLGLVFPYLLAANTAVVAYHAVFHRQIVLKTAIASFVPLGLGYLWLVQTA